MKDKFQQIREALSEQDFSGSSYEANVAKLMQTRSDTLERAESATIIRDHLMRALFQTHPKTFYEKEILKTLDEIKRSLREQNNALSTNNYIIYITDLNHDLYQLRLPIAVNIEASADEYVAFISEMALYSQGDTELEAILGLKEEIVSLYCELNSTTLTLGPLPLSWKRLLNRIIEER